MLLQNYTSPKRLAGRTGCGEDKKGEQASQTNREAPSNLLTPCRLLYDCRYQQGGAENHCLNGMEMFPLITERLQCWSQELRYHNGKGTSSSHQEKLFKKMHLTANKHNYLDGLISESLSAETLSTFPSHEFSFEVTGCIS